MGRVFLRAVSALFASDSGQESSRIMFPELALR